MPERLTDLTSENPPLPGGVIGVGDVVQFDLPMGGRTEGIVQPTDGERCDWAMRPVFVVREEDGTPRWPLMSDCVRVDPPVSGSDENEEI